MSQGTGIQWAHDTLNPWVGCQRISPACENCYAADFARRFFPKVKDWNGAIERQSAHKIEKALGTLERAIKPRRIFCGSMTDLGIVASTDPSGLANFLSQLYRVQEARIRAGRQQHAFIWLTKRPIPLGRFFAALVFDAETRTFRHAPKEPPRGWVRPSHFFPGLWVGVTAEDQTRAEQRIPPLLDMELPELLFVSAEPLVGPLRLEKIRLADGGLQDALRGTRTEKGSDHPISTRRIRWVVFGGETGHRARPSNPAWFEDLMAEIYSLPIKVLPFFKSWGAWGDGNPKKETRAGDQMVAWMGGDRPVPVQAPVTGYRHSVKRGAERNDTCITDDIQQVPEFLPPDKTFLLP